MDLNEPPEVPEQDQHGDGDLPTYDDLAANSGPNSRFGRWRGWVEKRAAERYADITPQERRRRRERGWGNDKIDSPSELQISVTSRKQPSPSSLHSHIQTNLSSPSLYDSPLGPAPLVAQSLSPTHLSLNQFGSRFLPHTTSQIRCLLPLLSDRFLLIGHDEGLSVLDMLPKEWTDGGSILEKGPSEAHSRLIWKGEAVYQMSMLEFESNGLGSPQGVVLALVGPDSSLKDQEPLRTLRMYNLTSLTSLAKWATVQEDSHPLDLSQLSHWHSQSPSKRHRSHASLTKSLRSLVIESNPPPHRSDLPTLQSLFTPSPSSSSPERLTPVRGDSYSSNESTWDIVEDLPLRWATDYVPLATPGSRLINTSVVSFALSRDNHGYDRGTTLLAIATKANILLYQALRGERAFRFVKEFYIPSQPRNVTFIYQSVQDVFRSPSDIGAFSSRQRYSHNRLASMDVPRSSRPSSVISTPSTSTYGSQLSLFVIFEKKAGIIRLADAAVGEVDLYDSRGLFSKYDAYNTPSNSRRNRASYDGGFHKESKSGWILPTRIELPLDNSSHHLSALSCPVYILTRGKHTHILPSPLPANISSTAPLHQLEWESTPTHVTPRLHILPRGKEPATLQLVAMGDDGIEVQEIPIPLLGGKGKEKARVIESLRSQVDDGDTGFLCVGGQWHQPYQSAEPQLMRVPSFASNVSRASLESLDTDEATAKLIREQGIYGWCRKGFYDWRVFWVGSPAADTCTDEQAIEGQL